MELKSKRERVVFLLEHWVDTYETMHQADEAAGDGDGTVLLMPRMYGHPSVVELRRAIDEVRAVMPRRTAHMLAYFQAEFRNTDRKVRRTTKKTRKTEVVHVRVRERVVPRWVDHRKVEDAVEATVAAFRGEVFIPSELLEAA